MRAVVVLGSTGSVGTQALDVIASAPHRLRVVALAAGGDRVELLAKQTLDTGAEAVAVAKTDTAPALREAIAAEAAQRGLRADEFRMPEILAGPTAATEVAAWPSDVVLNGITGSIGLTPTLAAIKAGARVALANKESLVAGGPLVRAALRDATGDDGLSVIGAPHPSITPVDSEHSALAQCLRGGRAAELRRLVITASGGPFRGRTAAELADVTLDQALAHPTWDMGPVVTLNSATLVNKGLELIEAHELFNVPYDRIDVVVHPQSIVHSMVEFVDGASIAQAHKPDLRVPIAFGLTWPDRIAIGEPDAGLSWEQASTWNFEPLDNEAFPAVSLARAAGRAGRCRPAIYNAANEECIEAFLARRLRFVDIVATVERVLTDAPDFDEPSTVEDVLTAESWARQRARSFMSAAV